MTRIFVTRILASWKYPLAMDDSCLTIATQNTFLVFEINDMFTVGCQ